MLESTFPFVLLILALAGAGVGLFMAGQAHGATLATLPPVKAARQGTVDPYTHVPHRPEVQPHPGRHDVLVRLLAAQLVQAEERADRAEAERDEALALVEKYRKTATDQDRLRAKWHRLFKIERARVSYAFGELWDRRRRPSREKVAGIVLDFPDRPKLVPPVVAAEFLEAAS